MASLTYWPPSTYDYLTQLTQLSLLTSPHSGPWYIDLPPLMTTSLSSLTSPHLTQLLDILTSLHLWLGILTPTHPSVTHLNPTTTNSSVFLRPIPHNPNTLESRGSYFLNIPRRTIISDQVFDIFQHFLLCATQLYFAARPSICCVQSCSKGREVIMTQFSKDASKNAMSWLLGCRQ